MYCITQLEMRNLLWIGWLYQILPKEVLSYPINSSNSPIVNESRLWSSGFELQYALGTVLIIVMVSALLGCLCCRRTKGFQEFKDGSIAGTDTIVERDLELEISRPSLNQLQFEPLTVECFVLESKTGPGTPKPPASSHINSCNQENNQDFPSPCEEWFSPTLHVPRERLKYLREIGRGWFGKVVEGTQDLNTTEVIPKTNGVVVRILTEEASASERAWFLGEALPYLKLDHPNILKLLGVCLETDPYLLLFESCAAGDLKAFLKANRSSMETLTRENIPSKMAIDLATGLEHMHRNGFSHTDLSARNCLVTSDLLAKLGDYGIGVEKYPMEYYVVGDRALPIRWSAPESLVCTDTTIETRAITPKANLWSFAILLWEIGSWGERPYDYFGDDQVIEMILSRTFYDHLPLKNLQKSSEHFLDAIKSCWKLEANDRAKLPDIISILKGKQSDFDQRWESLRPNSKEPMRSLSLKELRESADSELWKADEVMFSTPQARFKLGPGEPVKSTYINKATDFTMESGSETEEESWRGRVERGAYTEKVKQKSKSVADLMILVHIDSDSEAEWSLGSQAIEKPKKRISSGSVGDLRTTVLTDEFDEALKKLRNPSDATKILKDSAEKPENITINNENTLECTSTPKNDSSAVSNNFVDVELWKNALEFELERKISKFDLESINFDKLMDIDKCKSSLIHNLGVLSAPGTPQSRIEDFSVDNEDFSNSEEVETEKRKLPDGDEEEDRKHLSTPDDERSSDSGFRDKESCEEEENPCVHSLMGSLSYSVFPTTPIPLSESVEEEQLKVLLELDTILDAEDCRSLDETFNLSLSPSKINLEIMENDINMQPLNVQFEQHDAEVSEIELEHEKMEEKINSKLVVNSVKIEEKNKGNLKNVAYLDKSNNDISTELKKNEKDEENDDEDSSTMSLRSDNSYVSFNLDEEFVTAIRNELREKLPHAQMSVVESQELRDGEESTMNLSENETKTWGDDEETSENEGSNIDIAIRYNFYGIPLSPILEERESNLNSESLGDASVASKISGFSEDVLVVDMRTNQVVMVEGTTENHEDDRDTSNGDMTEDDSLGFESLNVVNKYSEIQGKTMGAPMPSPEEESKWQAQFPIPLQLQDDLMSASFSTPQDWDSQDDDDDIEDDGDDSSSSEEFVWKRYDDNSMNKNQDRNSPVYQTSTIENFKQKTEEKNEIEEENEDEIDEEGEDEEDEEEFTPSAWDANLAPHRSALRSPEKTLRTGKLCFHSCCQDELDQKKNVWFKKQRYHCVYEYPKETPAVDCQTQSTTTWEPTTYAAWEEMIEKPNTDVYTVDYEESNHNDEEFFVSSGNRPFQFQVGDGRYVSQFFPGESETQSRNDQPVEMVNMMEKGNKNLKTEPSENPQSQQQTQLGELRHTRNRLKLDLSNKNNNSTSISALNVDKNEEEDQTNDENDSKTEKTETSTESPTTKDELSIVSIIRSPMESLIENFNQENVKCTTNGESDGEISELEMSFNEEEITKSSHRPLFLMKQDSLEQNNEAIDKLDETSTFLKTESETNEKMKQIETSEKEENNASIEDEQVIKSSEIDCMIKSSEADDEHLKKSVREST
ncbi:uncharacterized protein [Chelonus insularis]|uniref:uncharacterized protein isoform X2 n=1 Tax=Chelonus insularis TaxID=460826 RepID=UPI00158D4AEB|nr:uncharacterized protein LOC118073630 isoform X2 [Chelonus insularis]